ncbi:MAG: hypothetical protein ABJ215_00635 [Alphaproteobacteria bacterium]
MRFLFPLIVWGPSYVREFLEQSLPTQLAYGNLSGFPWLEGSQYMILTTAQDRKILEAAPIMRRLKRLIDVQYVEIDKIPRHNKYIGASMAQLEALKRSGNFDAIFFLYPDFICATGTITNAARRIVEGKDAVMFPIPAVLKSIFDDPAIVENEVITPTGEGAVIEIPPRLLVDASTRHFHPMISGYIMGGERSNIGPAYMIWNVPDEGMLFRCFHLHPLVIRVQRDNPFYLNEFIVSLDEEYVPRLFRSLDGVYFARDSDEFAMCSIRTPTSPPQPLDVPIRLVHIAHWAEEYAALIHREFSTIPFRWHGQAIEDEDLWEAVEAESAETIDVIRDRLATPDSILRFEDETAYAARARRRARFRGWREPVFHSFYEPVAPPPPVAPEGAGIKLKLLFAVVRMARLQKLRNVPGVMPIWRRLRARLA